jgi:peptidoglycan/xylan/chitin deacetylase (PgdA/CDA1 family)
MAIGNHSLTHACLSRCSDEKIEREISAAHGVITEALGREPRSFAFPDGDHDGRAKQVLTRLGYEVAFLFDHRLSPVPPPDPMAVSRVRVNSRSSLDRLRIILSGLHPAVHRLRGVEADR